MVVLEVRLPDMSGFEVCRQLKALPATAAIPVLYISDLLQDEELEARLFDDGADGYIPQPIEPQAPGGADVGPGADAAGEQARQREREEAQAERERLQRELDEDAVAGAAAHRVAAWWASSTGTWTAPSWMPTTPSSAMVGYTREDLARGPARLAEDDATGVGGGGMTGVIEELRDRGVGALADKQYFRKDGPGGRHPGSRGVRG